MKISEKDREILGCAYFQADAPMSELARQTGYKEHVVRYSLQNLIRQGIIRRYVFINPYALGLTHYYASLAFTSQQRRVRQRAIRQLMKCHEIAWIGELGAEFQFGIDFYANGPKEVADFFDSLSIEIGDIIAQKALAMVLSMTLFYPKFLCARNFPRSSLTYSCRGSVAEIDSLDHEILRHLVASDFKSVHDVARKLKSPASTVEYRIESLKRKGILVGICYQIIDYELLGCAAYMLLVHIKKNAPAVRSRIHHFCAQHRNVSYLAEAIGHEDCEIGVRLERTHEISDLVEDLSDRLGDDIGAVSYFPQVRPIKLEFYPFSRFPAPTSP